MDADTGHRTGKEENMSLKKMIDELYELSKKAIASGIHISFEIGLAGYPCRVWVEEPTENKMTASVTAKRNVGDAGNDFVAGLAWKNGRNAEADTQWTFPDGTVVKFTKSVINVKNVGSGDSTAVAPLEFDIMSNGKPEITPAA